MSIQTNPLGTVTGRSLVDVWRDGWTLGEGVIFQGSFTSVLDHQLHSELNARIQPSTSIVNMSFTLLCSLCSLINVLASAFPFEGSLVAQLVKNLPSMWKTWVQSLGCKDPLEKGMAIHFSILAGRIPWGHMG